MYSSLFSLFSHGKGIRHAKTIINKIEELKRYRDIIKWDTKQWFYGYGCLMPLVNQFFSKFRFAIQALLLSFILL